MRLFSITLSSLMLVAATSIAQPTANPEDVASIESVIDAAYEAIQRAPGENYDWDRFASLFHPKAILVPQTEQRGGEFSVLSVQGFIDWINGGTNLNDPNDKGFAEEGYHIQIDRYGDVASVISSYQKRYYGEEQILGRGINAFVLVWNGGRWWITSVAWDETNSAGPIPAKYGGGE